MIDHGKNLPFYTTLTGPKDAHEIVNHDSSLRHIMSMCTYMLKENKGMISTLAGTCLELVACLKLVALRSSCLHQSVFMQKFLAKRQGVAFMCDVLSQRGIPSEQNLSLKEK